MADTTTREGRAIPPVEFLPPACPLCEQDLVFDSTWGCERCHIHWPDGHMGHGVWDYDDLPACGTKDDVILYPHARHLGHAMGDETRTVVCQLDRDHQPPHAGYDPDELTDTWLPKWVRWDPQTREAVWP